jgi:hypothetical protein
MRQPSRSAVGQDSEQTSCDGRRDDQGPDERAVSSRPEARRSPERRKDELVAGLKLVEFELQEGGQLALQFYVVRHLMSP